MRSLRRYTIRNFTVGITVNAYPRIGNVAIGATKLVSDGYNLVQLTNAVPPSISVFMTVLPSKSVKKMKTLGADFPGRIGLVQNGYLYLVNLTRVDGVWLYEVKITRLGMHVSVNGIPSLFISFSVFKNAA